MAEALPPSQARFLAPVYRRLPLTLVRGQGAWVETDDGRRLLDLVGGIAVNVLGHCHPEVVAAASAQLGRLLHCSNLYFVPAQLELAEELVGSAFPSQVFFANSGAEVNEAAIKVARKWGRRRRQGAFHILTLEGAFHGRTLGALAATGQKAYSEPFEPLPQGFRQLPRGDLGAVERALADDERPAVAVMVEPIQGESGVHELGDEYLRGLRELCDRHQALLILDEIQCGMGRTGTMWAHQRAGIVPDLMTAAKGLGGGLPLGALLIGPRAQVLEPGDHGSTFGGNPVACAAGLATLRVLRRDSLPGRALALGEFLGQGLGALAQRGLPVAEVRGRGLLLGLGLSRPLGQAVAAVALEEGLLVNPIGASTLRLAPPLTLTEAEAEQALAGLERALARAADAAA
ncbi:MAG: aspartate aminotransferase family protein [Candidatus Dormibacteria bacterium]